MFIYLAWGQACMCMCIKADINIFSLKSTWTWGWNLPPYEFRGARGKKGDTLIGDIQQGSAINIPGGRPANISSQHWSESDDL